MTLVRVVIPGLCLFAAACGNSTPSSPTTPAAATITISPTGAAPKTVEITLGERVLFINNDTRTHNMSSDPHPEHTDCPAINQVGFLAPGQQRETGNFVAQATCGFHDHDNPDNAALRGTIRIR